MMRWLWCCACIATAFCLGCAHRESTTREPLERKRILVLTPTDFEFAGVVAALDTHRPWVEGERQGAVGSSGSLDVFVIRTGWGKSHAAGATALGIARFHAQLVIMAGVGGGLDAARVESGDVVIVEKAFQHDLGKYGANGKFQRWSPESPTETAWELDNPSDAGLVRLAASTATKVPHSQWCLDDSNATTLAVARNQCLPLERRIGRSQPRVCAGKVATGDGFVEDVAMARDLASSGAIAVDMETAAASLEARNEHVPFVAVRVVADVVGGAGGYELYKRLKPAAKERLTEAMQALLQGLSSRRDTANETPEKC